jgi:hypothetical protein
MKLLSMNSSAASPTAVANCHYAHKIITGLNVSLLTSPSGYKHAQ